MRTLQRFIGDEDPIKIWWTISGTLVNFASGYTFAAKLATAAAPGTSIWSKSTGFTGAAGSGTESSGTPNLTVAFATTGEFNDSTLTDGLYELQIVATLVSDSSESTMVVPIALRSRTV